MKTRRAVRRAAPSASGRLWASAEDPALAAVEAPFFQFGFQFLARLYGAVLGRPAPRSLQKSLGSDGAQRPPGWGDLAKLFSAQGTPEELVAAWQVVVDRLAENLLPAATQAEAARRMALQGHLLGRVRACVAEGVTAEGVTGGTDPFSRGAEEALVWTRVRALSAVRELDQRARRDVIDVMVRSRQAGEGMGALQQRLFDRFSEQNRDWRRVALTETAAAVANGTLAAVDPAQGWEAEWVASPTACASCRRWHEKRFRVVDPASPTKDGLRDVWVGKTNEGRSASPRTRDGRQRSADELWWPAQPCHPLCRCRWVLRRVRPSEGSG